MVDPEGTRNNDIEKQWFGLLDGETAETIRLFHSGEPMDSEWRMSFSIFVAQLLLRSPAAKRMVLRDRQAFAEDSLREMHSRGIESLSRDIERYRSELGEDIEGVTAEDVMETFERGGFTVTVTEGPFLEHLFKGASMMARWIAKFDWEVLVAPVPKTGFIVCDYPFTLVPPSANREAFGFGIPGCASYLPLSRLLCLKMSGRGSSFKKRILGKEEVRIINQNTAVNSERFVMSMSKDQLEFIIKRSRTEKVDPIPRDNLDVIPDGDRGTLFVSEYWPRRSYFCI